MLYRISPNFIVAETMVYLRNEIVIGTQIEVHIVIVIGVDGIFCRLYR